MTSALEDRYDDRIAGVLSCYDRVVITGTLPTVCYAERMTRFLYPARRPDRSAGPAHTEPVVTPASTAA